MYFANFCEWDKVFCLNGGCNLQVAGCRLHVAGCKNNNSNNNNNNY